MNPRSTAGVRIQRAVLGVTAPVAEKLGGLVGRLTRPPADRFALPDDPAARPALTPTVRSRADR